MVRSSISLPPREELGGVLLAVPDGVFLLAAEPATVVRFTCDEAEVLPNFQVFPKPRGRPLESDHELAIRDFILQYSFNFGLVVFIRIQGILGLTNLRRNALEKHSFRQGPQNVSVVPR